MKHIYLSGLFIVIGLTMQAQVGINTTTPREMLDVNGNSVTAGNAEIEGNVQIDGNANTDGNLTVGVDATVGGNATVTGNGAVGGYMQVGDYEGRSSVSVMGVTNDGKLQKMNVAGNLEMNSNTIIASGSGYYFITNVEFTVPTPNTVYDDLDLALDGDSAYKTVIRITQTNPHKNFEISGIAGGVEGRHIVIINTSNANMTLLDNDSQSLAANRILTYGPNDVSTSGQGSVELVYDGTNSIVLAARN